MFLSKFLDPKNDYAFKRIFGAEKNKDILIQFLNDVITFPDNGKIQDVIFLKTTLNPEVAAQKASLVDILCQDEKGQHFIVEMQVTKDKGFAKRAQYYASKVYVSQMQIGQEFFELKEVIFLAIVDFTMFPNKKGYKSDHVILDKESYEHDLKDFSFTFIELPKFTKEIDQLANSTEKWVYFFKHAHETTEEELQKMISSEPMIARAYKELDSYHWNKTELLIYDEADLQERVYRGALAQQYDEGYDKGVEAEREKLITAMLNQGVDDTTICTVANLPLEMLKLLKQRGIKKNA
jgi:predicted transposase/invertase (TIGR01784 family)